MLDTCGYHMGTTAALFCLFEELHRAHCSRERSTWLCSELATPHGVLGWPIPNWRLKLEFKG